MKRTIFIIVIIVLLLVIGTIIPGSFIHNKVDVKGFTSCALDQTKKNITASGSKFMVKKVIVSYQDKDDSIYTQAYTWFGIPNGTYRLTHIIMGSDGNCTAQVEKVS